MVTNSVFITVVISIVLLAVSSMTLVVKVLGDRIDGVAAMLGGRIDDVGARVIGVETRMTALEGAVRDVGERLTVLETDLGKR